MEDVDLSRPGTELFPESGNNYNSYLDVNADQVVEDPFTGVNTEHDVADQPEPEGLSDKEMNFRALRDQVAKFKEEMSYWKGQAEAFSKTSQPQQTSQEDAYSALDWEDSTDIRKAFDLIRRENQMLRSEVKDAITAVETKSNHSDWNNLVSQHVPKLTSDNPIFAEMIKNAANPYEAAYALAQLNAKATQALQATTRPEQNYGQRAIANAQKPASIASVGGSSKLSAVDYYATMSDKDFIEMAAKNLANI